MCVCVCVVLGKKKQKNSPGAHFFFFNLGPHVFFFFSFSRQGDKEREKNITISAAMDRFNPIEESSQLGFVKWVLSPLFSHWTQVFSYIFFLYILIKCTTKM